MKLNYKLLKYTIILVALATLSKLFFSPKLEWSGFSPVIAIALFSGMIVKDKSASFLLPLCSLVISDLIIEILFQSKLFPFAGFYSYQILNYSLLLLTTLIGWIFKGKSYTSIFGSAFIAATLFFLLSNFTVWVNPSQTFYNHQLSGLLACYAAGLPFYIHSLTATFIFLPASLWGYNYIAIGNNRFLLA